MSENGEKFSCTKCGADLKYKPGAAALVCPFCGTENAISVTETRIEEKDYNETIRLLRAQEAKEETIETIVTACGACGAEVSLGPNKTAGECAFCGSNIIAQGKSKRSLKPESLLPFQIAQQDAADRFRRWLQKRWFAPSKLKSYARPEGLKGVYSPYWTYDAGTVTEYSGSRGDYYIDIETYTEEEDGKSVSKTREVRKIRWSPVSGVVENSFDDVLVHAAENMDEKYVNRLEPWDLENLVPYDSSYLPGFQVESYSVDIEAGLAKAKERMAPVIEASVIREIGGDLQTISSCITQYNGISFKHVLLPVWMSAYRYQDKVYQFLVNARTGEIHGERPWSAAKIMLFVLVLAAAAGIGIWLGKG